MSFAPGWRGTDVIMRENELKHRTMENRASRIDLFTPAEKAIYDAMVEVEKLPADERLTKAVMLLTEARALVTTVIVEKEQL